MTFEDKIKTTCKEVTENSDASSKTLKSELKKIHYDVIDASSKNLKVSRKSSTRSTSDSNGKCCSLLSTLHRFATQQYYFFVFFLGGGTVCKMVCPILLDRCPSTLSVLSVTLVYCGQTVGQIKMKLDMQVGLGPGHIVLDEDSGTPPPHGRSHPSPIFGPYLLWRNGSMDQDATWHGGRPGPKRHCVRWGPSFPP